MVRQIMTALRRFDCKRKVVLITKAVFRLLENNANISKFHSSITGSTALFWALASSSVT
jgi:hypothetical protein